MSEVAYACEVAVLLYYVTDQQPTHMHLIKETSENVHFIQLIGNKLHTFMHYANQQKHEVFIFLMKC